MPICFDVANYFLAQTDEEAGDLISNLKLQKLVYYAQGFHVAMFNMKPLFNEPLEAWTHGPVVVSLYHAYKSFGSGPIPRPKDFDPDVLTSEIRELLDEVYKVYGQYSAWKLRNLTHEEPWCNNFTRLTLSVLQNPISKCRIDLRNESKKKLHE